MIYKWKTLSVKIKEHTYAFNRSNFDTCNGVVF